MHQNSLSLRVTDVEDHLDGIGRKIGKVWNMGLGNSVKELVVVQKSGGKSWQGGWDNFI